MRIGIYNEQCASDLGGSDACMALLAESLQDSHQVEIVTHSPTMTIEQLSHFTGTSLAGVRLRRLAPEPNVRRDFDWPWLSVNREAVDDPRTPWRHFQVARSWHAAASAGYDLFINFAHWMPPFCHARRGVLVVLFPVFRRLETWPWKSDASEDAAPVLRRRLRRWYIDWEWRRRMASYQVKTAISELTRGWTKRWWGIDCQTIYPPVDTRFEVGHKSNTILSVGRFATIGHSKQQLETVTAFRHMAQVHARGWEYYCIGGLGDEAEDRAYFDLVRAAAHFCPAHVIANLERVRLKRLYEQAKVFWHATGYEVDDQTSPELTEHFGIVTVEAMAAGCVPIVINKGAQPEIVQHGVSGFLWNTLDELKEYTLQVVQDEHLRARMAVAAQARAQHFSRENFVRRFRATLGSYLC